MKPTEDQWGALLNVTRMAYLSGFLAGEWEQNKYGCGNEKQTGEQSWESSDFVYKLVSIKGLWQ